MSAFEREPCSLISHDEKRMGSHYVLTKVKAVEIYMRKISVLQSNQATLCPLSPNEALKGKSESASAEFGVSPKTIRDIWNRRTWQHATFHLWAAENMFFKHDAKSSFVSGIFDQVKGPLILFLSMRKFNFFLNSNPNNQVPYKRATLGRPPGSRDRMPRKRPFQSPQDDSCSERSLLAPTATSTFSAQIHRGRESSQLDVQPGQLADLGGTRNIDWLWSVACTEQAGNALDASALKSQIDLRSDADPFSDDWKSWQSTALEASKI